MQKETRILIAGFGGQGVLTAGQLLCYAGMNEGLHVCWMPSYGPEMRGGTANCSVVISSEQIGSPVVDPADVVVVMNRPSLEKFESLVKPGGMLFINSSLIEQETKRADINIYKVPATDVATELGNVRTANIVMLGALLQKLPIVKPDSVIDALLASFGDAKAHLAEINRKAIAAFVL